MSAGSDNKKNRGSGKNSLQKKIHKLKKPGKTYTPAQLLALKRKAQGKTIAQVKAENEKKMRDRARERNAKFKKNQKLKIKNVPINFLFLAILCIYQFLLYTTHFCI